MANVGDTLPHCTGTGTQADPYIYNSEEGFIEAIAVTDAYVEAGQPNLIFDANNRVVQYINPSCASIQGRNTTIRNLLANMTSGTLIYFSISSQSITINDMNFYNMCLITTASDQRPKFISTGTASGNNVTFNRCNFTGIVRGLAHGEGYFVTGGRGVTLNFNDCTFNINFDVPYSANHVYLMRFTSSDNAVLDNCTICVSGKTPTAQNYSFYITADTFLYNCVFTNSPTNPLRGADQMGNYFIIHGREDSSYNYFKLNVVLTERSKITFATNLSKMLVNLSKITLGTDSYIDGGIQMQETDPTASDYIYDSDNLANAGFMVGQVIE